MKIKIFKRYIFICLLALSISIGIFSDLVYSDKPWMHLSSVDESLLKSKRQRAFWYVTTKITKQYIQNGYMCVEGKISNSGETTITDIKVRVEFLDAYNNVLDYREIYAITRKGLEPGESRTFTVAIPANKEVETIRIIKIDPYQ